MKKLFIIFFLLGLFSATEVNYAEVNQNFLEVSLEENIGVKKISFINDDNEQVSIEIEKEPQISRLAKGTYKVSKSVKGSWEASYNVSVNTNNQFTGANKMSVRALKGSILSNSLNCTASKATCSFKQKAGTITSNASVVATISNGKLVVK